ncbi:MAG: family 10 glycosylhydrolase [Bacteroidota bacterium]
MKRKALLFSLLTFYLGSNFIFSQKRKDKFVIASWISPKEGEFKQEEWKKKISYYDSLGISEILVEVKHLDNDKLKDIVAIAKQKKIKVHAWMWTFNRPGDTIANKHPEWYSVNRNGQNSLEYRPYVDHYQWLSPFHPKAREHIKNNVRDLMKVKGLASVHLDFVRYVDVILPIELQPKYNLVQDHEMPEYDFGYHPLAIEKFKEMFGKDPTKMEHPEISDEWRQFRYNAISSLVNEIVEMAHKDKVKITAAVFPFPELAKHLVRQPWDDFNIDAAYPMLYNNFYNQGVDWVGFATKQGVNVGKFPIYSGLFTPAFENNPQDLKNAIVIAKENGAKGISLFTADLLTEEQKAVMVDLKKQLK